MDFGANVMASTGHGIYTVLSPKLLPPLYLAYNTNAAGDSGKNSDVKARWHAGDETIRSGMASVAALADGLMEALRSGDFDAIPTLMARDKLLLAAAHVRRRRRGRAQHRDDRDRRGPRQPPSSRAPAAPSSASATFRSRRGGGGGGGGGGSSEPSAYLLSEEEERLAKEDFASRGFEFMKVKKHAAASGGSLSSGGMVLQID